MNSNHENKDSENKMEPASLIYPVSLVVGKVLDGIWLQPAKQKLDEKTLQT